MKTISVSTILQFSILILGIFIASYLGAFRALPVLGSVGQGSDYYATTTTDFLSSASSQAVILVKGGYGSLGSVIVTSVNTGQMFFYDATTSDVTKRTGNTASSTIQIAVLGPSVAVGTYVFDVAFGRGLLMVRQTGTAASTTVTYR